MERAELKSMIVEGIRLTFAEYGWNWDEDDEAEAEDTAEQVIQGHGWGRK